MLLTNRHPPRPRRAPARLGAAALPVLVLAVVLFVAVRDGAGPQAAPEVGGALAGPAPRATALDPELARRFAVAQQAAAADGVELTLTSGWRSASDQQRLVDQALARYGDPAEAHRWVLPPQSSAHVQGLAIDVGGTEGAAWLTDHGQELGLCRRYVNEIWHFEMLPDGADRCPALEPDSSAGW